LCALILDSSVWYLRSPPTLLKEIILVDDGSFLSHLQAHTFSDRSKITVKVGCSELEEKLDTHAWSIPTAYGTKVIVNF